MARYTFKLVLVEHSYQTVEVEADDDYTALQEAIEESKQGQWKYTEVKSISAQNYSKEPTE